MSKIERDLPFIPRGLSRVEAARYVGVSPTLFDQLVEDGRMPRPKHMNRRNVWDRLKLDIAFDAIEDEAAAENDPYADMVA